MPIVEAVAVSANAGGTNTKSDLAKRIEKAMSDAVTECYANGVTDPEKVREAILAARYDITHPKAVTEE